MDTTAIRYESPACVKSGGRTYRVYCDRLEIAGAETLDSIALADIERCEVTSRIGRMMDPSTTFSGIATTRHLGWAYFCTHVLITLKSGSPRQIALCAPDLETFQRELNSACEDFERDNTAAGPIHP